MNQSKVTAIVLKDNQIYGVSDDGYLVMFDADVGGWVARGTNVVMNAKKAATIMNESFVTPAPTGRHSPPVAPYVPTFWERVKSWLRSFNWWR